MRSGKSGSLKGRNKWVRPESGQNSAPAQPNPLPKPSLDAASKEQQPALKKVGKFALARDPAPKQSVVAAAPTAGINKNRFKYKRPKDSTAAAAPAATLPVNKTAAVLKAAKVKPTVRPGKLRWNKYVRQSIGGGETTKQPTIAAAATVPSLPPPAEPSITAPAPSLSAAELQRRKRSKRISAASELVRKHQGRKVAQPRQHAMQLLRLGGQLYARGGSKGRGISLKLQNSVTIKSKDASIAQKTSIIKPKPRSAVPTTATPGAGASSDRSTLPSTRSASKLRSIKQKKPMSRLKGGRLVYCPVYCHTGRCPRRGRGCPLRHDPTKRAVCPLWLQGKCSLGATCPLQHQSRPELMPACVHYLQGRCTRSECPYLHVDLPSDAPHCAAFLRGYCAAGAQCASKHYTLKQIKEERKLVAGKGGKIKKKEQKKPGDGDGERDEKPKKRKKRRGRYFDDDDFISDGDEKSEERAKDDVSSESSGGDDDGKDEKHPSLSSSFSEEDTTSEAETTDEKGSSEDKNNDDEHEEEEEDQPPKKRSRRLTGAPPPDFIGF